MGFCIIIPMGLGLKDFLEKLGLKRKKKILIQLNILIRKKINNFEKMLLVIKKTNIIFTFSKI